MPAQTRALTGGFADPALQSAATFRNVMEAMARPGLIKRLNGVMPPKPVSEAAGAVLLTLCDTTTPLHLAGCCDVDDVRAWVSFHIGAPIVARENCAFALGFWTDLLPLDGYPIGTPEYPDRSATLIAEMPELSSSGAILRGPGIKETAELSLPDLKVFQGNNALFPLGLDFIFTSGSKLAALPRSTEVR